MIATIIMYKNEICDAMKNTITSENIISNAAIKKHLVGKNILNYTTTTERGFNSQLPMFSLHSSKPAYFCDKKNGHFSQL